MVLIITAALIQSQLYFGCFKIYVKRIIFKSVYIIQCGGHGSKENEIPENEDLRLKTPKHPWKGFILRTHPSGNSN